MQRNCTAQSPCPDTAPSDFRSSQGSFVSSLFARGMATVCALALTIGVQSCANSKSHRPLCSSEGAQGCELEPSRPYFGRLYLTEGPPPLSDIARGAGCSRGVLKYSWSLKIKSDFEADGQGGTRAQVEILVGPLGGSEVKVFAGVVRTEYDSASLAIAQDDPSTLVPAEIRYDVAC